MSAATTIRASTATLDALEEAWAIACEYLDRSESPPCDAPAQWWLVCRECGTSTAECDQHRVEEHQVWRAHRHSLVHCDRCHFEVPASRWRDLLYITPIEGLP